MLPACYGVQPATDRHEVADVRTTTSSAVWVNVQPGRRLSSTRGDGIAPRHESGRKHGSTKYKNCSTCKILCNLRVTFMLPFLKHFGLAFVMENCRS